MPNDVMQGETLFAIDLSMPVTTALQGAMPAIRDRSARDDLLFLERWEMAPLEGIGPALRVQQIRRANPELADAIRAEVRATGRAGPRRGSTRRDPAPGGAGFSQHRDTAKLAR